MRGAGGEEEKEGGSNTSVQYYLILFLSLSSWDFFLLLISVFCLECGAKALSKRMMSVYQSVPVLKRWQDYFPT